MFRRRAAASLAAAALPLSLLVLAQPGTAAPAADATLADAAVVGTVASTPTAGGFDRVATYPVFRNVPAGTPASDPTVAEISAVTEDGRTVVYTDALGQRIGFLDITDPASPVGRGTIDLAVPGHADDQPTSVAVVGPYLLVVVDETGGDLTAPRGRVDVYTVADRTKVRSIDLGGQPDSVAISPDQAYAAIAIENQRDEELGDGGLPQAPAGFVQVLDLVGAPAAWTNRRVDLTSSDLAGLDTPQDAEPEYVAVNEANKAVVTLQENNGIAVIDLPTGTVESAFSAGTATVSGVDTTKDGLFNPTGTVTAPREPDAVAWVDETHVATANEGDWKGGTRGWTVFDTTTGDVVWDAGNTFEKIVTAHGMHNNDRAAKKGAEPEGLAVATIGGKRRGFVGSERSNLVAVYDLTDPAHPVFEQALPTTNGPEGLLPVPGRDLFIVSSETDEAAVGVRASVGVYAYGEDRPAFPSIVSAEESNGQPIGWGALGALSAAPGNAGALWAASDAAYRTARLYKLDVSSHPAVIDRVVEVRRADGSTPALDVEGLHARPDGGFWAAVEGATGTANALVRLRADGTIAEEVQLPAEITAKVGKWGLEGVTASGSGAEEVVHVVLQRPLFTDTAAATGEVDGPGVARIGRYVPATGEWTWFAYQLESTSVAGDWTGLSEITTVDSDTVAVIERDKQMGTTAALKRVYTVDLPATGGSAAAPVAVTKRLAVDVLPALRDLNGWTQEKLEGLTVGADGQVYAVTDNDGLKDATGETQLLRLGRATDVFATTTPPTAPRATRTKLTVTKVGARTYRLSVSARPASGKGPVTGKVVLTDAGTTLRTVRLEKGRAVVKVRLSRGTHLLRAALRGSDAWKASTSPKVRLRVR
ncbi:MAG: esterase-like activity of phytase family protein [Nocardioides sp.]|uniref:esterase-like activity of phytase family protein n=1 Tax=Nocardioides sp. TaxID=35761 RepID=UPI003F07464E